MIDSVVTLVGSLIETPEPRTSTSGLNVTSFRVACTSRRFDRSQARWVDGATMFITVSCWRQLAENVVASLRRGDRILVSGRLRQRVYQLEDGTRRAAIEVDAETVGPDLTRHTVQVRRAAREPLPIPRQENGHRPPGRAQEVPPSSSAVPATSRAGVAGLGGLPVSQAGVAIVPADGVIEGPDGADDEDAPPDPRVNVSSKEGQAGVATAPAIDVTSGRAR